MVLVISPLISLMEAQVAELNKANIPACLVGSAQLDSNILARIQNSDFNVVYCSPEYLFGDKGDELLKVLKRQLIMIAVDGKLHMFMVQIA